MIEKAHKHSTVNAENVEIVTVAGNLNRSSARLSSFSKLLFFIIRDMGEDPRGESPAALSRRLRNPNCNSAEARKDPCEGRPQSQAERSTSSM